MFAPCVEVALAKAKTPAAIQALAHARDLAAKLDALEAEFETKINQSKSLRGEGPTKLRKAKRQQVAELARDAQEMEVEQRAELRGLATAREVVSALQVGLQSDVDFWSKSMKHVHPAEVPIVREFLGAKRSLLDAFNDYLAAWRE